MYTLTDPATATSAIALFLAAAVLHATFQLSTSVMTLMSGHALGQKRSHARLLRLCGGYVLGNMLAVLLLILGAAYIISTQLLPEDMLWLAVSVLGTATGLGVLIFYYPKRSNRLWIPRGAADYLYDRSAHTKRSFEAFGLGITTAVAELPFIAASLLIAAMILRGNPDVTRLGAAAAYAVIVGLPLLVIMTLVGGGKRISQLQQWREKNRFFLQLVSGIGLIIISLYGLVIFGTAAEGNSVNIW